MFLLKYNLKHVTSYFRQGETKMLKVMQQDQFDNLYKLLEESFPADEYRDYKSQQALLSHPLYKVFIYEENQELSALFATWEGEDYIYLEHFAVKESLRNGGLGSKLLGEFLSKQVKPVVLEIEIPNSGMEKRRAEFYVRNGFNLNEYGYDQPAFSPEKSPVPMVLMSYPESLQEQEFKEFKEWIFSCVYEDLS